MIAPKEICIGIPIPTQARKVEVIPMGREFTKQISEVVTGQPIELVPHVGACVVDISLYVADIDESCT